MEHKREKKKSRRITIIIRTEWRKKYIKAIITNHITHFFSQKNRYESKLITPCLIEIVVC